MKSSEGKQVAGLESLHPFEKWLSERHRWLQTAAARMIQVRALPDAQAIQALAELCLTEASKKSSDQFETVAPGALAQAAVQPPVRLRKLSEVRGVNAIKDGAILDFGNTGLTVVYGSNGSGKSGYSRLIKQICGSRAKEELLGNVFAKDRQVPSTRVHVAVGDKDRDSVWTSADGALRELRHVHVFDSNAAALYFGQNEATYAPSRMRFLALLIRTCDLVADELTARKDKLQSTLPQFPSQLANTPAGKWLTSLKAGTSAEAVEQACQYTEEMDRERIAGEGSLAEKDVPGKLLKIEREIQVVVHAQTQVTAWKTALGDEKLLRLLTARKDAQQKRRAANEDASKVFAGAALVGIGQASWRALWEKAREYSVTHAYTGLGFPQTGDGARCVLCQQALDSDARARMQQFEDYVKGGLEKDAKQAEQVLNTYAKELAPLPEPETWMASATAIKLDAVVSTQWYESLMTRRNAADTAIEEGELPPVTWETIETPLMSAAETLAAEKRALTALQQDETRQALTARVLELLGRQWLARERTAILEEVKRLDQVSALTRAIALTATAPLTRKNTELADQELRGGYQARFIEELKALNGSRLPVEPRSKQQGKGKVTFSLAVKEAGDTVKAEAILSEGERRIIALAAFLADIAGSGQMTPFVFDDPISSLDQDFEERVVERLVKLAHERQVIIFTHRLSLLAVVESTVKKLKEQAGFEKTTPPVELHVTSLRRLGKHVGLVADMSSRDAKPEKALNRLRDESLRQLRKLYEAADLQAYEERAKGLCSDLRILVERCVESVLLNDVLVRFRRSITTQGRIGALAKISVDDCAMIDDLMTRYSVFEHSQSSELPAELPDMDLLERDVHRLIDWVKEFAGRPAV